MFRVPHRLFWLAIPVTLCAMLAFLIPTGAPTIDICFTQQETCETILFSSITPDTHCALYRTDYPNAFKHARVLVDKEENDIPHARAVDMRGLMHHKFCVTGDTIITGSTNPTHEGLNNNDNNLLVITSPVLAQAYRERWDRLVVSDLSASSSSVYAHDMHITVHFCRESCIDAIVSRIKQAKSSVRFMVFTFTHPRVAHALIEAHHANITVAGIVEKQSASRNIYDLLTFQGINILQDGNPATLHHKTFLIDNTTVITGSFNPTKSADSINAEDLLIIDNTDVAKRYLAEWERVYALAQQNTLATALPREP